MSTELQKVSEFIRQGTNDSVQYELNPHLSLLYKNLAAPVRRELAGSISIPFSEVSFDAIKAVRCILPTESRADIEAWHFIAGATLSGDRV